MTKGKETPMRQTLKIFGAVALAGAMTLSAAPLLASPDAGAEQPPLHYSYHRLLPLEGGSNFRDLGGYRTADGKTVVRGQLFRSGAMAGLTEKDMAYLNQFDFKAVVDLRSSDEIELFPNRWANNHDISYVTYDYSFRDVIADSADDAGKDAKRPEISMEAFYPHLPTMLKPQLTMYFDQLLAHNTPLVVNCSAGQDRTGAASSLLLTALGVPRDRVIEDYLLSTDYRDAANEKAGVDLEHASEENAFARMMLRYRDDGEGAGHKPQILKTDDGVPYITFMFAQIEEDYGSVENYLDKELSIDAGDIAKLREMYLN